MCMRKEVLWHQVVSSVWLWACCDLSYRGWPQTTIRSPSSLLQGETKGLAEQECISTGCAETSVHDWPIHQAVRSGTRQRRAAELSAASKLLGKSGRGFKQASYAILDRKYEDVKRRINYAARARAIVQLEETLSSVPRIYIRLLANRHPFDIKMDYFRAGLHLCWASNKLSCLNFAVAEGKLHEASVALEKNGGR